MRTVGKAALLLLILLNSKSAFAETIQTNLQGVILKNVKCKYDVIAFNVSNKTTERIKGYLRVTIFDSDGDPIDNGGTSINVGPVSGAKIKLSVSCGAKYAFRIE